MAKKSTTKRIKFSGNNKVMRRPMALGHSRANKSTTQMNRKKRYRGFDIQKKSIKNIIKKKNA